MRLTPVKLYTTNYIDVGIDDALDNDISVWASSSQEAAHQLVAAHPKEGARLVITMHPDGDQTFRIDPAPVPSVGWVPGAPPEDGKWYLARYASTATDGPVPGIARWENGGFYDDGGIGYGVDITHHIPTPINLEVT